MREKIEDMLGRIREMRNEAFKLQNQVLYDRLGKVMAELIRVKELL